MILRALALAGGLAGGAGLSQFPEFSQQYYQRLSGAVDELRVVATAFDTTARLSGLSRDEALAQMGGSAFEDSLKATMTDQLTRYDRLEAARLALKGRGPLERLLHPLSFADPALARRTLDDFKPAVPLTADGAILAGVGFMAGWGLIAGLFALLLRPFRRRRTA